MKKKTRGEKSFTNSLNTTEIHSILARSTFILLSSIRIRRADTRSVYLCCHGRIPGYFQRDYREYNAMNDDFRSASLTIFSTVLLFVNTRVVIIL